MVKFDEKHDHWVNQTEHLKTDQLSSTEVHNKDWLLECEDFIQGKQTYPAKWSMLQELERVGPTPKRETKY